MFRIRSWVSAILVALMVFADVAPAIASSQQDAQNQSNLYNNVIAPTFNYAADKTGPFNAYFTNHREFVDPRTGDLSITVSDLSVPGRNGLDLNLARVYHSDRANAYRMGTRVQRKTTAPYDYEVVDQRYPDTYLDARNGLGLGWQWAFPILEMRDSTITYHSPSGSKLVDWNSASHFKDSPLLDIRIDRDSGSFSNGQVSSAYKVTTKSLQVTYFGSDGRLLGIKDRYNNRITFQHTTVNGQPVFSQITDTVGRLYTFAYTATQVTLTAPGGKLLRYTLTPAEGGKSLLASATDAMGRVTQYTYNLSNAGFSMVRKSVTGAANVFANLVRVDHPTGTSTGYRFCGSQDNLGDDGLWDNYFLCQRWDTVGGVDQNQATYSISPPNGFPTYSRPSNLPSTYTYQSMVTKDDNRTTTTLTYNHKHLLSRSETVGSSVHEIDEIAYDTTKQPTQQTKTNIDPYNTNGARSTTTVKTTHNNYGDLTSATNELNVATTFTYDSKFHEVTSITRPMNSAGALMKTEFTVNATTGNVDAQRQVYSENGTDKSIWTYFTYDSFGNQTQAKRKMADGTFQIRDYEFGAGYNSAYLTKATFSYTDMTGAPRQASTVYGYDSNTGLLTSSTDALGGSSSATYDLLGRPLSVTMPTVGASAAQKRFAYNDAAMTTTITDENGHVTRDTYDGLGRIVQKQRSVNGTFQTIHSYEYWINTGRLYRETDALGTQTSYEYDVIGRLTATFYPDWTHQYMSYDDVTRRVTLTDGNGNEVVSTYDVLARPIEVATKPDRYDDATTYRTAYTYDYAGNVVTFTDALGRVTRSTFDTLNRTTSTSDALGNRFEYTYDNAGNRLTEVGPDGRTTRFAYDQANRLLSVTDPLNTVTRFAFDAKGRQVSATDARNNATRFTYDARDRLVQQTDALSGTTGFTYDAVGNRLTITDARSNQTTYVYDEADRLVQVTSPTGASTRSEYDSNGNQVAMIDPLGNRTTFTYDERNRHLTTVNPLGNRVVLNQYDSNGNLYRSVDGRGFATYRYFDGLNRVTSTADPAGNHSQAQYDAVGNLTRSVDANGNATQFGYDALNHATSVTDALSSTWQYGYDAYGNVTRVTDPQGRVVRQDTFDRGNHKTQSRDALGTTTTFAYDPIGNVTGVQVGAAGSGGRSYTYDALNRVTGVTADGGLSISFGYDAVGNRARMVDGTGTTTYAYDVANRLSSKTVPGSKTIQYTYDLRGLVTGINDFAGNASTYAYDQVGRLSTANFGSSGQVSFAYDDASNRTNVRLPGGVVSTLTYNELNRLTNMSTRNNAGTTLNSYQYAYDPNGNLTSKGDSTGTMSYTYDANNRLTRSAELGGSSTTYAYDRLGNRTSLTDRTGTTSYTYDAASRLTSVATPSQTYQYTWDKNGNQLSDGQFQYTYDGLNRVVSVQGASGSVGYQYDGDGLMTNRTASEGTTRFYWAGSHVINEGDAAGNVTTSMLLGGNRAWGRKVAGTTGFYTYNGHGDVVGVVNSTGTVLAEYDYDAFGQVRRATGNFNNPYRYAGEYLDPTTQQYYLRSRFYSPATGRFTTSDTNPGQNSVPQSLNLYTYAMGNPMKYVDPSGHRPLYCDECSGTTPPPPPAEKDAEKEHKAGERDTTNEDAKIRAQLMAFGVLPEAIEYWGIGQLSPVLTNPKVRAAAIATLNDIGKRGTAQGLHDGDKWPEQQQIDNLFSAVLNMVPVAGLVKMGWEAASGYDFVAGRFLTKGERVLNGAVVATAGFMELLQAARSAATAARGAEAGAIALREAEAAMQAEVAATGAANKAAGTLWENYVRGTILKGADKMGLLSETERSFAVSGLKGQSSVRPDYTIYNIKGDIAAIADAKLRELNSFVKFDDQALGMLMVARDQTASKTLIYYTPQGMNVMLDARILQEANTMGVRVLQIEVR